MSRVARCAEVVVCGAVLAAALPAMSQTPPAFPGAEGFGAVATGGRGGQVLYVTNLEPSGPGSFQAALDTPGPRYILFKVSGLVDAPVWLLEDDVTIAGQTSPGGIIVRGFHTTEDPFCDQTPECILTSKTVENWILRHLRTRPSDSLGGLDDGLRLLHTRRAIVDHVSVANATDEAVQVSYSNDITIQNTILAETLGGHAVYGGMLLNYSDPTYGYELSRLSIHHNVWNRILGRMPEVSRESETAANTVMDLELANNLLWHPGYFVDVTRESFPYGGGTTAPVYYRLNWVANLSYASPGYPYGMISFPDPFEPSQTTTYFADNRLNLYPALADYQLNYCCNDFPPAELPQPPAYALGSRHPFPAVSYTAAAELRSNALANAGAFPRDPMDRRLMEPVRTGVFDPAPRDANPYGDAYLFDYPTGQPPPPPTDSDGDGMPDDWEVAHGLNPGVQDHNGFELSVSITGVAGYTNLECYLNQLADGLVGLLFADGFEAADTSRWSTTVP